MVDENTESVSAETATSVSAETATSVSTETATFDRGRQITAIAAGAIVFAIVMLLMLLAALQAPPAVVDSGSRSHDISQEGYARNLLVEDCIPQVRDTAAGLRELQINGYVRNVGKLPVAEADLRCYFAARSGGEISLDFPLVIDTRLDDVGEGPLAPMSGRRFAVRVGEFPDTLAPEILRVEVANVRLRNQ